MTHGVLILDKSQGPTSHDVVGRVRRIFRTRSVGHAGTLDPMATGVLVLGIGEGTKLLGHLTGANKAYLATIKLGELTDTLDAQGRVIETCEWPRAVSEAEVMTAAASFLGTQRQRVPEFSAVKQAGVPLYARARRGETLHAPEREVEVQELEILRVQPPELDLRVVCGKGFYVRALARDLARALGTVGHLTRLRRTHSGPFSLTDAAPADLLCAEPALAARELQGYVMSLAAALRDCPRCVLNAQGVVEVRHGRPVRAEHVASMDPLVDGQQPVALLDAGGALRALGRAEAERIVVLRGMAQA